MTTLGSGVDGSVMKRTIGYDGQGNASVFTSYDASNTVVNQVVREFNGFGQVTREYQAAAGAVNTSTTPFVQYDYSEADTGNHSRLTKITYPDGYEVDYNYATGVDDNISRLTSISDSTGTLESYAYQGEGTVLGRNHSQPGLNLTTTLDDFGRISDFNWTNSGGSVSHYAYGYDAAGNRLYKEDLVNTGLSELYGYDNLYQLTSFARGTLNSTKDAITGTPDYTQSWNHDALGNWDDVTTNGVTEDRDSNAQNEYTDVGSNSPAHDANGNMTTDQTGKHFVWDAWNRLVEVQDASSVTLKTYTYDALNRRVTDSDGTTTKNLYYSTSWQVVLESEGEPTSTTTGMTRYVWSPVYVDAMILRDRDADNNGTLEERLWVVQDANFNTVALVDNSGNVVERYKYTPFGVATVMDASGTVISGSAYGWVHLHQGLRLEEASGLYDNRFRWYSPTLGQFVSNDPIGFDAEDVNVRRYVGNGPLASLDFSGLVKGVMAGVGVASEGMFYQHALDATGIDFRNARYIKSEKDVLFGSSPPKAIYDYIYEAQLEDGSKITLHWLDNSIVYELSPLSNQFIVPIEDKHWKDPRFTYKCHSLTFYGTRLPTGPFYVDEKDVPKVLKSGFTPIKAQDAKKGDIMIWYDRNGSVKHSATIAVPVVMNGELAATTKLRSKNGIEEEGTFTLEKVNVVYSDFPVTKVFRRNTK